MDRVRAGSARQFKHICSDRTVNTGWTAIYNGSEALVSSATFQVSAAGHYYTIVTLPTSPGFYRVDYNAYFGTDSEGNDALWKTTDFFEIVLEEVDW